MSRHDLQDKCDHRKAVEYARSEEERERMDGTVWTARYSHYHCPVCGLFFAREQRR